MAAIYECRPADDDGALDGAWLQPSAAPPSIHAGKSYVHLGELKAIARRYLACRLYLAWRSWMRRVGTSIREQRAR